MWEWSNRTVKKKPPKKTDRNAASLLAAYNDLIGSGYSAYQSRIRDIQIAETPVDERITAPEPEALYETVKQKIAEFGLPASTRIIEKEYPDAYRETLVVLDGTTGQNALVQAKQFMEVADITGIILTKLDGTAKGGIAVAIQAELGLPVKYVGVGEKIDDLQKFNSTDFVNALFDVKQD